MPTRKYKDLDHLSAEEYKVEALKRRNAERKAYTHEFYIKHKEEILTKSFNKRLIARTAALRQKLEKLESIASVEK